MADYIAPVGQRKTFTDVIGEQAAFQQQRMQAKAARDQQQAQFEQSIVQKQLDRQAAADRANAKANYDAQKVAKKQEDARYKDVQGYSAENYTPSQRAAYEMLANSAKAAIADDATDNDSWTSTLGALDKYDDLFTNAAELNSKREDEYMGFVFEPQTFSNEDLEWVATEDNALQMKAISNLGGFNQDTLELVDGVIVAEYLDAQGNPLMGENGQVEKGDIAEAPYYKLGNQNGFWGMESATRERADISPSDYVFEVKNKMVTALNSDANLSSSAKKASFEESILSELSNPRTPEQRSAARTAKNLFKEKKGMGPQEELNESQVAEAIQDYAEKSLSLYNAKQSVLEQTLIAGDYAEQRLSRIFNQVNGKKDMTVEQKTAAFTERVNNVFATGNKDLDKRARATAKNSWEEANEGVDYNESEANSAFLEQVLGLYEGSFDAPKAEKEAQEKGPTQGEIRTQQQKNNFLTSSKDYAVAAPLGAEIASSRTAQQLGLKGDEEFEISQFQGNNLKGKLKLTNYLPDEFSRGEGESVWDEEQQKVVPQAGPIISVEATPGQLKLFYRDDGTPILELSNWTNQSGVKGNRQLPPVYIDLNSDSELKPALLPMLQDAFGQDFTYREMQKQHNANFPTEGF